MYYIVPHIHMISRVTDDYQRMAQCGCVAVSEPAFWAGVEWGEETRESHAKSQRREESGCCFVTLCGLASLRAISVELHVLPRHRNLL